MKKIFLMALSLSTAIFTSCNFYEDIYINDDGSGKFAFSFDASQMMQMMGDEMNEGNEEAVDSIISFKEVLRERRDSVSQLSAEKQKQFKSLENYNLHTLINPETKEMKFKLYADFNSVSELKDMFKAMNTLQELDDKNSQPMSQQDNPVSKITNADNTEMSYNFDGTKFSRVVNVIDKEKQKQINDSLKDMGMMFSSSVYKLKYHFPRPVLSVSNQDAMFSADRKTVILELPFMSYATDPEVLNLEVVLED